MAEYVSSSVAFVVASRAVDTRATSSGLDTSSAIVETIDTRSLRNSVAWSSVRDWVVLVSFAAESYQHKQIKLFYFFLLGGIHNYLHFPLWDNFFPFIFQF